MKSYTDIEQSKKLADILPIESADMWWDWFSNPLDDVNGGEYSTEPLLHKPVSNSKKIIPCWSLASLLEVLPHTFNNHNLVSGKLSDNSGWYVCYDDDNGDIDYYVHNSNLIDACYEMILKLNEEKLI